MKMFVAVATLAATAALGVSSASAQQAFGGQIFNVSDVDAPYATPYGALPPYEVLTIVRSMGFDPRSRPVLRGRVYIVHAFDDQNILVRVVVDARSGRVVNVAERGPMQGYDEVAPLDRYGAYPVPPSAVPNGSMYREPMERAPDYASRGGPDYTSRGAPDYSPAPYSPSSSSAPQAAAPHPRVASRTPPTTPTPRVRPQAAPQGSTTHAAAPPSATTSSVTEDSRHGVSVPAPVASRKVITPPDQTTAAKPETPAPQSPDLSLVPVAPLE